MEKNTSNKIKFAISENNFLRKKKINFIKNISSQTTSYIILSFFGLASIFPFFWSLLASFLDPHTISLRGIDVIPRSGEFTTINYDAIFKNDLLSKQFQNWMFNSLFFSLGSAFLNATFNLLGGYSLAKISFKGKKKVFWYFMASILVPSQATMVPTFLVMYKMGFIGHDVSSTTFIIALLFSSMANIFGTIYAKQYFMAQTNELEEAAKMDGSSLIGTFFKISLPKMLPLFALSFLGTFMGSWNNYLLFTLFAGGDPNKMTVVSGLNILAKDRYDKEMAMGRALAATNVSFGPIFIVFFLTLKIQRRGIKGGNK